jgi:hypothetical protein
VSTQNQQIDPKIPLDSTESANLTHDNDSIGNWPFQFIASEKLPEVIELK